MIEIGPTTMMEAGGALVWVGGFGWVDGAWDCPGFRDGYVQAFFFSTCLKSIAVMQNVQFDPMSS